MGLLGEPAGPMKGLCLRLHCPGMEKKKDNRE